jgi:hypothetical protein
VALFPDIVGVHREPDPLYFSEAAPVAENHVLRFRRALFPRWGISLAWDLLTPAQAALIDAHVLAHQGANLTFEWYDWKPLPWLWVPIAKGDGVTTGFPLPGRGVTGAAFFRGAGTAVTGTVNAGAGANGRDTLTVTSGAIPSGEWLWMNADAMVRLFLVTFERDLQPLTVELETGYYGFSTRLMVER